MAYNANIIITHDEDGYYAFCLQIAGCHAKGDTLEEVGANIRYAVEQKMATMDTNEIAAAFNMEVITMTMEVEYPGK